MLPDLSPAHILVVVVVALIVVGPKELPFLLRKVGKFVGRMRGMANEFRASFDEMARQAELDELRKEVEAMRAATQTAIPRDLGIENAIKSDSEGAYMAQWQASQTGAEPLLPGMSAASSNTQTILPPPTVEPAPGPAPAKPKAPQPDDALQHGSKPADIPPGEAGP
jgi:sec-independent protein translocase protein TatB